MREKGSERGHDEESQLQNDLSQILENVERSMASSPQSPPTPVHNASGVAEAGSSAGVGPPPAELMVEVPWIADGLGRGSVRRPVLLRHYRRQQPDGTCRADPIHYDNQFG